MDVGTHTKLRFGLWYDFRNPTQWRRPYTRIYGETLEQIVWAEEHGFDDVWLQEHHFHTDPERTWYEAVDHVLYQLNGFAEWLEKAGMPLLPHIRDESHLRELGLFNVVDVDTCIEMIRAYVKEVPITHYYSFTVPPGLPASWVQPHLELFASKVIPAFR